MPNYDIRYEDKYGQLAQIDVAAEGARYEPWVNQTLTSVNDSVVRLAVIEGELVDWHSHEHEDEFFLVLEGELELEVEGREPFVLGVHQGVTIPRGVLHHPRAARATATARDCNRRKRCRTEDLSITCIPFHWSRSCDAMFVAAA